LPLIEHYYLPWILVVGSPLLADRHEESINSKYICDESKATIIIAFLLIASYASQFRTRSNMLSNKCIANSYNKQQPSKQLVVASLLVRSSSYRL
jgi:hypothetical protein